MMSEIHPVSTKGTRTFLYNQTPKKDPSVRADESGRNRSGMDQKHRRRSNFFAVRADAGRLKVPPS
jgi:hypothetical protein